MSRPKSTTRRATREESIAHYLEVAIVVANDRAASLKSRNIDAPRLVAQVFLENFPTGTTTDEILEAIQAPYQVPATTTEATIHG